MIERTQPKRKIIVGRVKGSMWYTGTDFSNVPHPLDGDMYLKVDGTLTIHRYSFKSKKWEYVVTLNEVDLSQYYKKKETETVARRISKEIADNKLRTVDDVPADLEEGQYIFLKEK